MKKSFIAIAAAGLLGLSALAGQAAFTAVEAQNNAKAPVILVVNMEQLVAQSKAGKTIPDQAEAVRDIALGDYDSWGDAERIAVNVATLYREFSGDSSGADTLSLFGLMAELYFDRKKR